MKEEMTFKDYQFYNFYDEVAAWFERSGTD